MTDATPATDPDGERSGERRRSDGSRGRIAFDVPSGRTPVECPYCGRPLENEGLLALHRAQDHSERITDEERTEYEAAFEAESARLRRFRLKALAALVVVYFGFLMIYAVV
ncbi:MAG: C2H2-type zinc finger protein [Halosimplex sp.]